ncbi:hypothetical protein SAMN05421736_105217 [Evansella caseinilytica]|uniref:Uncharacterized protein n=1 Tax=Evansella caseinilytica TaxID=1503961 RepID=A0A1H3PUX4_9BACI|nr:hypothetical protein [Evansella caseinilytica]SDZ04780.1 hypothetical protein SAMN05421736_105217 [Evansella caseinilytica]
MRRNSFGKFRFPRWVHKGVAIFYQVLVPLIIFQFFRTLLLPTTFDMILLGILVLLYLNYVFGWIS